MCSPLRSSETSCTDPKTAVCQVQTSSSSHHFKLGEANSTLVYEDGSLKLHYSNGDSCHSHLRRNTSLLFVCDGSAHSPEVSEVDEDACEYVVVVRTKLACPPAVRASECVFFNGSQSYDFSDLSRSPYQGNWEARDRNGSVYYINVCQPLNLVAGCSVLSGVCKESTAGQGGMSHANLGLAYGAAFDFRRRDGEERIRLTYRYTDPTAGPRLPGQCQTVETVIEFVCNKSMFGTQVRGGGGEGGGAGGRAFFLHIQQKVEVLWDLQ